MLEGLKKSREFDTIENLENVITHRSISEEMKR